MINRYTPVQVHFKINKKYWMRVSRVAQGCKHHSTHTQRPIRNFSLASLHPLTCNSLCFLFNQEENSFRDSINLCSTKSRSLAYLCTYLQRIIHQNKNRGNLLGEKKSINQRSFTASQCHRMPCTAPTQKWDIKGYFIRDNLQDLCGAL